MGERKLPDYPVRHPSGTHEYAYRFNDDHISFEESDGYVSISMVAHLNSLTGAPCVEHQPLDVHSVIHPETANSESQHGTADEYAIAGFPASSIAYTSDSPSPTRVQMGQRVALHQ